MIIPYKMWQRIRPAVIEKKNDFDPEEYRGIYKDLELNWDEESRSLRDEWDRQHADYTGSNFRQAPPAARGSFEKPPLDPTKLLLYPV